MKEETMEERYEREVRESDQLIADLKAHKFEQDTKHKEVWKRKFRGNNSMLLEVHEDDLYACDAEIYEGETLVGYMKYVCDFDGLARFANAIGYSLNTDAYTPA